MNLWHLYRIPIQLSRGCKSWIKQSKFYIRYALTKEFTKTLLIGINTTLVSTPHTKKEFHILKKIIITFMISAFLFLTFHSCSIEETSSSFSSTCCLQGQFYDCPTSAAMETCNLDDFASECPRQSSKDSQCEN